MPARIPIGVDDFRELREGGLEYVDKSHLIRELLDDAGVPVTLLPRPRRFGKTLNLSMLRCFFEKRPEDLSHLFEGLSIWQAGEAYRQHFQRYPVLHLTFKDIKAATWDETWDELRRKVEVLFDEHRYLLDGGALTEREAREFRAVLEGSARRSVYRSALLDLSRALARHHGAPVIILVDEYDEPVHVAYLHGFAEPLLDFFRAFLSAGLKGNPHLFKGVLTGILRLAKESLFSGLNNLAVYSLLRREASTCFGFTEPEVASLLERQGRAAELEDVRSWYNGYRFGDAVVYNPWSILNYAASRDRVLRGYWITTSSNDLVRDALQRHALAIEPAIEALLEGGSVERRVDEHVVLSDVAKDEGTLFDLLLFSGYLRAEPAGERTRTEGIYRLSIPNREVRAVYTTTFQRWMRDRLGGGERGVELLKKALFEGDAEGLEEQLQAFTTNLLSYHDLAARDAAHGDAGPPSPRVVPEQVIHGFVIGLLATLEPEFEVRSNRESGAGRPDVMIRPRLAGKPGAVLELKVARTGKRSPEAALREGIAQIREHDYVAELRAAGANPARAFVAVFDGKRVWVRAVGEAPARRKKAAAQRMARRK
jgi:hypothetical protein